ncbi:MAG: hypothetical protein U0176_24120 [Bacteroidia bacterium]
MKNYQWVAVGVSFVLAVTLWLLVTLNKQSYTTTFDIPVKLTNFPNNLQLLSEFPKELKVVAFGPGIKLFYERLDPARDTVDIDFEVFRDKGYFTARKNLKLISDALKQGLVAVSSDPDTISLAFAVKSNKKVPVRLDIEWDLPPSYRVQPQDLRFTDSVLVVGPTDSLNQVTECKTIHFRLPRSVEPQTVFVPLQGLGPMQMLPNSIKLQYTPRPYTERIMRLPVSVAQTFSDISLHFEPDSIELKLLVPLERYEALDQMPPLVEVSVDQLSDRSAFVVPTISKVPEDMEIVGFSPVMVRYIMISK